MPRAVDPIAIGAGVVGLAAAVWTVGSGVVATSAAMPAVLVPALFLLAGLLGPIWLAARFTCRALVAVGTLHLTAIAASAAARAVPGATEWHAASLLLYVAGFAVLLPLAAAYPSGPMPRAAWIVAACCLVLPLAAEFSAPTPAVLNGDGPPTMLGPVAPLLPGWVAPAATAVFLLPAAAVVVGVVRAVRGGRELRGRLLLPLLGLTAFALLIAAGSVIGVSEVATAVFLVAAPLVPAGLVLGARPLAEPLDGSQPVRFEGSLEALSPREREVLAAMADGRTNAVIARELHMSLSAVEKHTTAIFTKLGLAPGATTHRRVAAVVAYLRAAR